MAADAAHRRRSGAVSTALFALLPLAVLALVATRLQGGPPAVFSALPRLLHVAGAFTHNAARL